MASSNVKTPVFIETNLGTCIALPFSPDISAKEFKREVERVHLNCFPRFGNIKVNGLMVKQRSHYYHLSESLPLKCAFQGSNDSYFSKRRKKRGKDDRNNKIVCPGRVPNKWPLIAKERFSQFATRAEFCWSKNLGSSVIAEALSEALSESISVSGLITKYFSDCDEVASSSIVPFAAVQNKHKERLNNREDSRYLNVKSDIMSPVTAHKPMQASHDMLLEKPSSEASREKHKKPEVGKRLLLASNSLGLTPSSELPALSLCKSGDKRSRVHSSAAMVRTLVFEIPDVGD